MGIVTGVVILASAIIVGGTLVECCRRLSFREVHVYYHTEKRGNKTSLDENRIMNEAEDYSV